ncbi:MAG: DUF3152 domain-containing protein [Acidimicrobiia bacterium]|nr:DUF3152 domain-containing protein [Acidimicrobiia bacterium]MDH5420540.1 DUF3152 domain-containing protein [Acidimicrobiia bacterium]MDH5502945.1 DUF3152 domain-containing protein [Acidimicrobiia bacterium]
MQPSPDALRHRIGVLSLVVIAASFAPVAPVLAAPVALDCSIGADRPTGSLQVVPGSSALFGGTSVETFSVEVEAGLGFDAACLAEQVESVLGDPRSWIHVGSLGWKRVDTNPDLRIIFTSPALTDQMCAPLNTGSIYSCRNGNRVVLNSYRWRSGTPEYAANLNEYRTYQINHEVGHYLGNGHVSCPGSGRVAPVMMQQTKGLDGCTMNGWPFPSVEPPPEIWDGKFKDDDGSVFEADIEWIATQGITLGCNPPLNDHYCPGEAVTRGQMAAFLDRAFGLPTTGVDFFTDDNGTVFESSINRIAQAGITLGCRDATQFCPDRTITREEMAAFLHRSPLTLDAVDARTFVDIELSMFADDIAWLSSVGITHGCNPPTNDRFCPTAPVTRGQMAAFLRRALDR